MRLAIEEAQKASREGEVPVGAIIVDGSGAIVARAHNETETRACVSSHAELLAIERASEALGRWRLSGCTLYCTLEPCPMCMGAIQLARIDRLVYGAPDLRLGALGSFVNLTEKKHPFHTVICEGGVLEEESAQLMRAFFKTRRLGIRHVGLGVS